MTGEREPVFAARSVRVNALGERDAIAGPSSGVAAAATPSATRKGVEPSRSPSVFAGHRRGTGVSESVFAALLRRFRWCKERSPEGFRCKLRLGHNGLHVPHMGRDWAWGGNANSQSQLERP